MQYKMKYTSYLAALSVLFATACAKEEITEYTAPAMPEDAVRFSGSVERLAGTRTSYEDTEESVTVQWADKDRIGVFCVADGVSVAANYGYYRWQADVMIVATILLVVIVQIIQELWNDSGAHEQSLNNFVAHLRKYLSSEPALDLLAIPRVGYQLKWVDLK